MDIDNDFSASEIDEAQAVLMRSNSLFKAGKAKQAIAELSGLVARYPSYLSAHRLLAKIHLQLGNLASAHAHLALAASGDPDDAFANVNLEATALEFGFLDHAASRFAAIESCVARPEEIAVHQFNKGKILYRLNDYAGAAEAFRTCLASNPNHAEAALRLLETMQAAGSPKTFETAQSFLDRTRTPSLELLSVISDLPDRQLRQLAPHLLPLAEQTLCSDENQKIARDFVIARLCHASGDHDRAWAAAKSANAPKREQQREERERDRQWEERILAWSRGGDFPPRTPGLPPIEAVPVFVLGPSRSGKTTLEGLLSKADGVRRGYENKLLSSAVAKANNAAGRLPSGFLPFLPDEALPAFGRIYHRLFAKKAAGARALTTTTPGLIAYVPTILSTLPDARFVLMRRAMPDLIVRTYFKNYRSGHNHAYDPRWIVEYIDWYEAISREWEERFPRNVKTLSYEELVVDPLGRTSAIAAWCGLPSPALDSTLQLEDDRSVSKPYLPLMKKEGSIDPSRLQLIGDR